MHVNRGGSARNTIFSKAVCAKPGSRLIFSGPPTALAGVAEAGALAGRCFMRLNYSVACRPLGRMFAEAGLRRIDFSSVDIEGSELRMLEAMDWRVPVIPRAFSKLSLLSFASSRSSIILLMSHSLSLLPPSFPER